ncbi:hypothetical protein H9P43_007622 [Blastocladiella emersonii ATCC 22665]|nr:hypothetical protein H9P43_007622 [Blastocladiella emersonii ATCC 22665]
MATAAATAAAHRRRLRSSLRDGALGMPMLGSVSSPSSPKHGLLLPGQPLSGRRADAGPPTWVLGFRLLPFVLLFGAATYGLYLLVVALPPLESGNTISLHATSLHEVQALAATLQEYSASHFAHVLTFFAALYVWKQTFSIPGAMALNLIAGSLYGAWGTALAIGLTAVGASLCYLLSHTFASPLVRRFLIDRRPHGRVAHLAKRVRREQAAGTLAYYLLFLRVFPLTPNWLLNLASPVVGVPLPVFFLSAAVGLAPYNLVTTQAGSILASLTRIEDIVQPKVLLQLALVAAAALIPVVVKRRAGNKLQLDDSDEDGAVE